MISEFPILYTVPQNFITFNYFPIFQHHYIKKKNRKGLFISIFSSDGHLFVTIQSKSSYFLISCACYCQIITMCSIEEPLPCLSLPNFQTQLTFPVKAFLLLPLRHTGTPDYLSLFSILLPFHYQPLCSYTSFSSLFFQQGEINALIHKWQEYGV